MDINDLLDGIAEAFRQYQAEMTQQEQASLNPNPAGLEPETETEKTEKKVATEKGIEQNFPKKGVIVECSTKRAIRRKSLIYRNKKTDPACRTRQQDRFV